MTTRTTPEQTLAAVKAQPMFRGLRPEDQARIAAIATMSQRRRGDFLWHEGDPSEQLAMIVRGRVKIVRHTEGGDVILEIFGEGEPVGAIAVYNAMPYPASAVCMEPTTLLHVPRRDYFDLIDRHPGFARALIRDLTRIVLALTRKIENLRGQRVEARIAHLFVTLTARMGRETGEGIEIGMHLSRQEVAELVGTTVESAIRVLSRWGREGILVTRERGFLVPSVDRLRDLIEGGDREEDSRGLNC